MRMLVAAHRLLVLCGVFCCLPGCPTVDTGETPVEPPPCRPSLQAFKDPGGVWDTAFNPPDENQSCVAMDGCHSQSTGRSALRLVFKPSAAMTDIDWQLNYEVITRYLNCSQPEGSPVITKPEASSDPHVGGNLWVCEGAIATCEPEGTIIRWIESI